LCFCYSLLISLHCNQIYHYSLYEKEKWLKANGDLLEGKAPKVSNIDSVIQKERIYKKQQITYTAKFGSLPNGTMIEVKSKAYLVWKGKLFQWSFNGYSLSDMHIQKDAEVTVLTPKSYVKMFSSGFTPGVHESVN